MSTSAVERIFVLLAFAGLAFVVVVGAGALLQAVGVGRLGSRVSALLDGLETALAWIVALTATAGSLYFSEVADFVPCELCWFQRIAMYPLVVVFLIALVRQQRSIWPYGLALSLLGLAVAVYHYQLEYFPEQATFCSTEGTVSCTVVWFKVYEVGTLPMLAGTAFLVIAALMAIAWRNERAEAALAGGGDDDLAGGVAPGDHGAPAVPADEDETGLGRTVALAVAGGLGFVAVAAAVAAIGYLARGDDDATDADDGAAVVAGDPAAGSAVYVEAGCGACHVFAPARSTGTAGPALDTTTLTEPEIRTVVADGKNAMVGYGDRLSDQEIADVAAYIARG